MAQEPDYLHSLSLALMAEQDELKSLPDDVELLTRVQDDDTTPDGSNSSSAAAPTPAYPVPISQPDIVKLFLDEIAGGFPSQSTIDTVLQQYALDPNTRLPQAEFNYLIGLFFPERKIQDSKLELTLIHIAAILGHTSLTKRLIARGAHVNGTDKPGDSVAENFKTPLMVAVENGSIDDIRVLLQHRATIDFLPTFASALYLSSVLGRDALVTDFLSPQAVQNYLDRERSLHCALWGAVQTRYYNIVDNLLTAGASPYLHLSMPEEVIPEDATTPATYLPPFALAVQGGDGVVVELLMRHADAATRLPLLSDNLLSALAHQIELNNVEVFKSLQKYGYNLQAVVSMMDTNGNMLECAITGTEINMDELKATPYYLLHTTRMFFVALEHSQADFAKRMLDHLFDVSRDFAAYTAGEGLDFLLKSSSPIVSDVGELFMSYTELDSNALPEPELASSSSSSVSINSPTTSTAIASSSSSSTSPATSLTLSPELADEELFDFDIDTMMESFTTIDPSPASSIEEVLPDSPLQPSLPTGAAPTADNPMWLMDDNESLATLIELANTDKFKNHFIEVEQSLTGSLDSSRLVKKFFEASDKSHRKFVDASLKPEASSNFRGFARLFPSHLDLIRTGLDTVKGLAGGRRPDSLAQVYSFIHVASCMDIAQGSAGRRVSRDVLEQGFRLWRNCLSEFATLTFSPQEYAESKGTPSGNLDTGPPTFLDDMGQFDPDVKMSDIMNGDDQLNFVSLGADNTTASSSANAQQTYNEKALLDEIAFAMVEEFESAMAWISAQTCDNYSDDIVMDSFLSLDADNPEDIGLGGLSMSLTQSSNGFRSAPNTPSSSTKNSEVGDLVGTFLFVSMAYFIKTIMRASDDQDEPKFKVTTGSADTSNRDSIRAVLLDDLSEHGFLSLYGNFGSVVSDAVELGWLPSVADAANFLISLARLTFVDTPRALWKHTSTDFRYFVSNVLRMSCSCPAYGRLTCNPGSLFNLPPASRFGFLDSPCCQRMDRETAWSDANILGFNGVSAPPFIPGLDLTIPEMILPPTPSTTTDNSSAFGTPDSVITPFGKPADDPIFDLKNTLDTPLTEPSPRTPATPAQSPVNARKRKMAASNKRSTKRSKKASPKEVIPAAIGVYVDCDICGKKIALNFKGNSKSNLIKHRETHTKTVTKCSNSVRGCTATFTRKDNMKAHARATCAFRVVGALTPDDM